MLMSMTLIRPSFGYCKVQLVKTSKEGYVASEDIKPASPTLIAALNAPLLEVAKCDVVVERLRSGSVRRVAGVEHAVMLDGGISAQMLVRDPVSISAPNNAGPATPPSPVPIA